MWRRASSHLQTLATPWRRSAPHLLRRSAQNTLQSRAFASIISSPFRKTSPLLSSESGNVPTKKRVEDVMPIATGYERAELEAELEGRKRFTDMDTPVGPFGTKTFVAIFTGYAVLLLQLLVEQVAGFVGMTERFQHCAGNSVLDEAYSNGCY
ncbi:cytochrome c oxidase subunit 5b-2, mitochondrial isoform X3 [Elaeis guineensis]|uniref:cytochrome c oxidase subunit 5b-2, mitochondrial isoform X3 n=1 Tax=Elaeis guineensis var. tenera TaxID=51953 RepID=UPI003C6CF13E